MLSRDCLEVLEQTKSRDHVSAGEAVRSLATLLNTISRLSHTWQKTNQLAFTKILVFVLEVDFKTNIKSGANYSVSCFLTFWFIIFQQGMVCSMYVCSELQKNDF
jgi:hypothetical protein